MIIEDDGKLMEPAHILAYTLRAKDSWELVQLAGQNDGDAYIGPDKKVYTSAQVVEAAELAGFDVTNPRGQKYDLGFCPSSLFLLTRDPLIML